MGLIQGITYNWIKIWLTQRTQCVVVNGHNSNLVQVQPDVTQGTVLGPLMFLLYVNDIKYGISSHLKLFQMIVYYIKPSIISKINYYYNMTSTLW